MYYLRVKSPYVPLSASDAVTVPMLVPTAAPKDVNHVYGVPVNAGKLSLMLPVGK